MDGQGVVPAVGTKPYYVSPTAALCAMPSFAASPNFKIRAQKTPILRHSAGFLAIGRDVSAGALAGAGASKKKAGSKQLLSLLQLRHK